MNSRFIRVLTERLRYCRRIIRFKYALLNARINKKSNNLPDILCVGVPKAATTWLYVKLIDVNKIFLPKGKELHFFDECYSVESSDPIFNHEKTGLFWRQEFDLDKKDHWQWYKNQFLDGEEKIKFDITPTYCRVSLDRIRKIKQSLPDAKIILIIRNPIERVWSGASYFLDRYTGRQMNELKEKSELRSWVFDAERLDYSNYIDMITNWDKVYSDTDQILYIFHDDIVEKPDEMLSTICDFIGLDKEYQPRAIRDEKRVNSNYQKNAMPSDIRNELNDIFLPQIHYLEERFQRDLSEWLS